MSPPGPGMAQQFVRALELQRAGHGAEAETLYRAVAAAGGTFSVDARINLGALLDETGCHEEALQLYREALLAREGDPVALNNTGSTLFKLGRFAEAAQKFRLALEEAPDAPEPAIALGASLLRAGELEPAVGSLRETVARHPGCADAHWNLSLALLMAGEFGEGWAEYQWRWRRDSFTSPRRDFAEPSWDGSPLAGRRILVHGEQGFGDTIQFARYLPMVAQQGGTVIAECQSPSLLPLLRGIPGVAECCVMGDPITPFDLQVPLLSLPYLFGTTLESIPDRVPYLAPPQERLPLWEGRLSGDEGFKVGIVWAGKPVPDPFRSCTLTALAPLFAIPGVTLYSLQVGEAAPLPGAAPGLVDLTSEIRDFGDTAALVSRLDLVISIDTSVAHLAGALGKPVWLLLPMAGDYRWLFGRDDSPWYPSMRLFRQQRQGEWGEAVDRVAGELGDASLLFLERKVAAHPLDGRMHYLLGQNIAARGRIHEASARFSKASLLLPGSWEPLYALAGAQQHMGMWDGARESLEAALRLQAELPLLHEALGVVKQVQGDLAGAMECYREVLRLDPGSPKARYNLATACKQSGRFAEALEGFREVVRISPGHADAHWNLAVMLLMTGELEAGWREFPWRFRKSSPAPTRRWEDRPAWDGSALSGRTILLYGEQGAGDTLQFVRYAPLVAGRGGRVLLEVQSQGLRELAASVEGVEGVFACGDPPPEFELQSSLMDLPGIFGTTLESVPARIPYLHPDPARLDSCRALVPADGSLRVGLVWRGNPAHANDANRSLALERLAPLAGVAGASFYSLQLGEGAPGELNSFPGIRELSPHIGDFSDTAALAAQLDLVVSADTSVAHLAGALGVPVWLLVPCVPDWRWLLDREDSPWYPTMRLFRQGSPGDWDGVVSGVGEALAREVRARAAAGKLGPAEGFLLSERFGNEGCAHACAGRHLEAIESYEKAIELDPRSLAPHYNMGNSLYELGRTREAMESFRRALAIDATLPQGWHNLALAQQAAGLLDEALESLLRAVAVAPGYLEARHNLGELRHRRGELEEAKACFREILERDPGYLPSWNALGVALQVQGRLEEAAGCYRKALSLEPDYLHALNNLGAVSRAMEEVEQAIDCYRKVLALDPEYADARWNLALVQLQLGEYREGWQEYEWRFRKDAPIPRLRTSRPLWDGSPLAGRVILVHAEQGFGDAFQFVRYAPLLARQGATVLLQCQSEAIAPVMKTVPGVSRVLVRGEPLPDFDCHAPLMSLPHLCGTLLETVPAPIPYFAADPELLIRWRERLSTGGFRVGLVWAGRKSYRDDLKRSLSLPLFAPLAGVAGADFYALQVGDGAEQVTSPPSGLRLTDLGGGIRTFADTAAIVSQLDLVISADTAVAHLAGGLGVPVWVLLPTACDWRWLMKREDSPWYPSARLFRQQRRGDWGDVLERVAGELARTMAAASGARER